MSENESSKNRILTTDLFGRRVIYTPVEDLTEENVIDEVNSALCYHVKNMNEEERLYWYRRGLQPILMRKKERNKPDAGVGIRFAVVVTLREMYNVNRIEEFVQRCSLRGWIVNRIDIEIINQIYAAAEVDIEFDD